MIGHGLSVFDAKGKAAVKMFYDEYEAGDDEPEDEESGSAADFGEEFTDGGDEVPGYEQSPVKDYSEEDKMDEPDGDVDYDSEQDHGKDEVNTPGLPDKKIMIHD